MGFNFVFDKEKAVKEAPKGKFVERSGAYICKILNAKIVEVPKTKKVNLELKLGVASGQTFDAKINMIQSDGKENFRMAMVQSLIFLLDEPTFNKGNEAVIIGTKIGVFYKYVCKKDGDQYANRAIEGFFEPKTFLTSTEKNDEKEAKKYYLKEKEYEKLNKIDEDYLAGFEEETVEEVENEKPKATSAKGNIEEDPDEFPF